MRLGCRTRTLAPGGYSPRFLPLLVDRCKEEGRQMQGPYPSVPLICEWPWQMHFAMVGWTMKHIWDVKLLVLHWNHEMVDLRSPLRMRAHQWDPDIAPAEWFRHDRVAVATQPANCPSVRLSEIKPLQPGQAAAMAQDLRALAARGFDEFVRECPAEVLTALETSLVQKGVMLHESRTQYWSPENHLLQGRLSQPETGAILRLNSVVTSLR